VSDTDSDVATPREVFYIALCETNTNDEEKGNNSGPVRLKKEEGLQMTAREGEQSRETQRKEKKPNLLSPTLRLQNLESDSEVAAS